jgi:hypothetical protein
MPSKNKIKIGHQSLVGRSRSAGAVASSPNAKSPADGASPKRKRSASDARADSDPPGWLEAPAGDAPANCGGGGNLPNGGVPPGEYSRP